MSTETKVGVVEKFFAKPSVAAVKLEDSLSVGDTIHFKGSTTDFSQKVDSMQIEHATVQIADKGASIGIKVSDRVRPNDQVFKVVD